jgi:hypothetical protein
LGRIQAAAWLAARQSSTAARNTLAGKNIFQLRAAVETVEAATQQQQGQQQQQPQIMPLPTSDESEALLRIRHSVSGSSGAGSRCSNSSSMLVVPPNIWGDPLLQSRQQCGHQ